MEKRKVYIIISLLVFIVMVGGISYSLFVYDKNLADVSLSNGEISISLSNINGSLNLGSVLPKSDVEGINSTEYLDFNVNATVDTEKIYYEVYIMPKSGNTLNTNYLKTYLTDQQNNRISEVTLYNNLSNSEKSGGKNIYKGLVNINNNGSTRSYSKDFRLRLWLDENYEDITSKIFNFDIKVYAYNVRNVGADNISYGSDLNCNTVQCQIEALAGRS